MIKQPVIRKRASETYPQMYARSRIAWAEYRDLKAMDHYTRWGIDIAKMSGTKKEKERRKLNLCRAWHNLRAIEMIL